jgi:hypothetical protein
MVGARGERPCDSLAFKHPDLPAVCGPGLTGGATIGEVAGTVIPKTTFTTLCSTQSAGSTALILLPSHISLNAGWCVQSVKRSCRRLLGESASVAWGCCCTGQQQQQQQQQTTPRHGSSQPCPAPACSPDKWKAGSSNTVESGGRKVNTNKALEKKSKSVSCSNRTQHAWQHTALLRCYSLQQMPAQHGIRRHTAFLSAAARVG